MGRLIKFLFFLIVLAVIGLVAYSFLGDLSPPTQEILQTVTPDEN